MGGLGVWEGIPSSKDLIVLATPHTGLVSYEWALQLKVLQFPAPFNIISNRGLPIDQAREELVKQARNIGASHVFFLDSDVMLPQDGLQRLWQWKLPVVAGIYGSKHLNPAVWIEQAKTGQARYAALAPEHLEKASLFTHPDIVTGAGCLLIDLKVFDRLKEPWFFWTQGREQDGISEDFYFCEKVREAGIPIHIDCQVRCRHVETAAINWKGERERLNA